MPERTYSIIGSCLTCIKESSAIKANTIGYSWIGVVKLQLEDKDGLADIYKSLELLKSTDHSCDITYLSAITNVFYAYQLKNEIKPDKANIDLIDQYELDSRKTYIKNLMTDKFYTLLES